MKLTFPNKTELETDIIIGFLNEENIRYQTKLIRRGIVDIYDIQVDTSYEYFMFINKLVKEKLEPYLIAMRSFCLPSYEPKEHKPVTFKIDGTIYTPFEEGADVFAFQNALHKVMITEFKKAPKKGSILSEFIKKWIK